METVLRWLGCCHRGGTVENILLASCVPAPCPLRGWSLESCVALNVEVTLYSGGPVELAGIFAQYSTGE